MSYHIVQKDSNGCGVACVAFILNKKYSETLNLVENGSFKAKNRGFSCKDLVMILRKAQKDYRYKYITSKLKKKIYNNYTIVFIKRSKKYPSGHYLRRYNKQWMDPWLNFQVNHNINKAKSGFRKRLPGKPIYMILV